jgi:cytochrome c553
VSDRREAYMAKLRDPRWQKVRLDVFNRDGWTCQDCRSKEKTLNVHHLYYTDGAEPWEYPLSAFLTLCHECHEAETIAMRASERGVTRAMKVFGLRANDIGLLMDAFEQTNAPPPSPSLMLAIYHLISEKEYRDLCLALWSERDRENSRRNWEAFQKFKAEGKL